MGKVGLFIMIGLTVLCLYGVFSLTNQDCDKNPPMVLSCNSNSISDAGLNWSNCIKIQKEENNLIFPDKEEKWNCDGIEIEYHKTKCNYSPSNLTSDYIFCK